MNFLLIIFYCFAGLMVVSALVVLFTRNVLYAAFSLIVTFFGVAVLYLFAGADFVAVTQILVYIGGILVLIIFGIMLTHRISGEAVTTQVHNRWPGLLIGLSLFGVLVYGILQADLNRLPWIETAAASGQVIQESTIEQIGVMLMSRYIFPFELAALLLLVALIGAAFIAKGRNVKL
jgi:NADH:ubiquinone oxidoreductase subunit 6 (subunit J)